MTTTADYDFRFGPPSEETAARIRDLLADKGDILGSVTTQTGPPPPKAEDMAPGTSFHHITTTLYVDSGGHVHAVLIDEHTTSSGTVIEILADVAIN